MSQYIEGTDHNNEYMQNDLMSTKFVYPMHSMSDVLFLEQDKKLDMDDYREIPRKGVYSSEQKGFKTFNNPTQTSHGENAMKEKASDEFCKDRYLFATFTSLGSN